MSDIAIRVKNVSKKYRLFPSPKERLKEALHPFGKKYHNEFWALKDVSFDVPKGQTLGILGRNGSGKSTLLQVIASVLQPTSGSVEINGRVSALLELGAGFNPEFTGRDNVILNGAIQGIPRDEMIERMPEIEAFADIGEFFDQPVKTYSSGMFVRVAFAAAINVDPDILIVDEALAVGDIAFQEKCYRKLAEFQQQCVSVIFVTHDTSLIEELCNKAVLIDCGGIRYIGDPQDAVNEYDGILYPRNRNIGDGINLGVTLSENLTGGSPDNANENVSNESLEAQDFKGPLLKEFFEGRPESDNCQFRKNYNKNELRLGEGGAEICDYLIVACNEEDPVSISSHSKVSIYIKVYGKSDVNRPSIGVGIFTPTGLMVCSGNARLLNKRLRRIESGRYYIYRMDFNALLAGGDYFIHLGLTEYVHGKIKRHDMRRSIAHIIIKETPRMEGVADLSMHLEELKTFQ